MRFVSFDAVITHAVDCLENKPGPVAVSDMTDVIHPNMNFKVSDAISPRINPKRVELYLTTVLAISDVFYLSQI